MRREELYVIIVDWENGEMRERRRDGIESVHNVRMSDLKAK